MMPQGASVSGPRRLLRRLRDVMAGPGAAQRRLDQVVRIIATDMVAEVCSCYLMRSGQVLELFATEGLKPDAVHRTRLRVGEGLVGHIAAYSRPLNLSDAQAHPLYAYRPETGEEIYQSLMGVPILHGGRVVGVLVVQNKTSRHYDDEELEALQVVAMVLAELVKSGELVDPRELFDTEAAVSGPEILDGLPLVGGLALGTVVIHHTRAEVGKFVAEDPAEERQRLVLAIATLRDDVDRLLAAPDMAEQGDHRDVLETYRMFAEDSGWLTRIEEAIGSGLTAEAAVARVREDTRARMNQVADPYLRERMLDFDDLANRLIRHLSGGGAPARVEVGAEDFILVARAMGPAEFLDYDRARLRGLILEEGSHTTHIAIMARAFDVPMVGRVKGALSRIPAGETVMVDGERGRVVVRPGEEMTRAFAEDVAARAARQEVYREFRDKPARSLDGVEISLNINVGLLVDLDHLDETGADGVGLCRTEVPFMIASDFPDVDSQTELYRGVLDRADGRPVAFRTLDIGGDKRLPYWPTVAEENPAMGWRAIRVGLDQPAILRQQLRALIRAAAGRPLSVMFPMIASAEEFAAARHLLDRELARAAQRGEPAPEVLRVGVMLEVPALFWQLPVLLPELDFLSVGTNDLLQFLFASDRANPRLAGRYDLLSPAALSLMRDVVGHCAAAGVELSVCGEAAGQPLRAMALIGVGVRRLSMAPARVGPIKMMVRALRVEPLRHYLESLDRAAPRDLREGLASFARDHGINI
jgi:phosphotransferase system enzyme I (PtsP)